ncbi:GlsB/YeaQ/YmgE family stress response membrane protein [Hyalangium sp.]|uniref:GlsB/YeaQ/YmgE family stress response membrane protein n=1 Tax=Hyalangium sp. TaxID=2028555 RepID=UPI002D4CE679|nr:GlsB/YeaQ/YmgE family stress response membrane protein [Hyalangium sp.]HYI00261.1 GlsB/YeaQ/YmgE family stress response membrane protein [Hyalangium sp.]
MWSLLSWIVFGFVVGLIARFIMPGHQHIGFIRTTLLGIGGSFVGGFLSALIFGGNWRNPGPSSWIGAIIGAVVLLVLSETVFSRRR